MHARRFVRTVRRAAACGVACLLVPALAGAQRAALARDVTLAAAPDGRALATMAKGAAVSPEATKGGWSRVVLDGWIAKSLTGASRDSFEVSVTASGARLRSVASADGALVASLNRGMGLHVVAKAGDWMHVRRVGWVPTNAIAATTTTAAAAPAKPATKAPNDKPATTPPVAGPSPAPAPQGDTAADDALTPSHATVMMAAPDGKPVAGLEPGAVAVPLGRDRGWVKVRVEGWVRARDLVVADPRLRALSAADLRADPAGTKGRTVRWTIQKIQLTEGDGLRRDIAEGEPYLLARGPGAENAMLYVTVPPGLLAQARALPPMSSVTISARVRTGRSEPSGVPVLELTAIER